jgi:hypothetical protein
VVSSSELNSLSCLALVPVHIDLLLVLQASNSITTLPTMALASATTFQFVSSTVADSDPDAARFPPKYGHLLLEPTRTLELKGWWECEEALRR